MKRKGMVIAIGIVVLGAFFWYKKSGKGGAFKQGDCLYNMAEHRVLEIVALDESQGVYRVLQLPKQAGISDRTVPISHLESQQYTPINCPQY